MSSPKVGVTSMGVTAARPVLAALVAAAVLAPVLRHAGWPYNHDGLRPLVRAAEVAGQWRAGHALPIWSNAAQFGLGSPGVLLYHKLFSGTEAALGFVLPGPKAPLVAALLLMTTVLVLGTGAAVRAAAGRPHLAVEALCGTIAATSNYAATDWLTRGAVSEYSALCLLPWLFRWCFAWLRTGRPGLAIGPLMVALALAHSAIATFSFVLLGPAVIVALATDRRAAVRAIPRLAAAIAIFAVLLLPWALPSIPMIAWAQVTNMITVWRPETTHVAFARLFLDRDWSWTDGPWWGFSPQLDPVLTLALPALAAATIAGARALRPHAALCFLVAVLALVLQLRAALPVFHIVPAGEYIAFTWRLLAYADVALAIGLGVALLSLAPLIRHRAAGPALAAAVLVLALAGKPRRPAPATPWFTPAAMAEAARGVPPDLTSVEYPEYLPRTPSGPGHPRDHWQAALAAHTCGATPLADRMVEHAHLLFRLGCAPGTTVALDEFLAPGMRLVADGHPLTVWRTCDDARLRFAAPTAREVLLRMPTIGRALHDWVAGGPAYPHCPP